MSKITIDHGKLEYRIIKRDVYELEKCFVDPKHRRRGIATELIKRFLEEHGGYVYADVIQGDFMMIKILKRFGFRRLGKSKKYTNCDTYLVRNNQDVVVHVNMKRRIGKAKNWRKGT